MGRCQNCQALIEKNGGICYSCYTMRPHAHGFESDHKRKKRYNKSILPPRNPYELFALQKSEEYRRESRHDTPECRRKQSTRWRDSKREILKTIKENGWRSFWETASTEPEQLSQAPLKDGREPQVPIRKSLDVLRYYHRRERRRREKDTILTRKQENESWANTLAAKARAIMNRSKDRTKATEVSCPSELTIPCDGAPEVLSRSLHD